MRRHTSRSDVAIQGLGQAGYELVALAPSEHRRRARCEDKVTVQVHDQSVVRGCEQRLALGGDAQDVRARLLDQLFRVASVHDRDVETAPLVDADAEPHGLGGHGQHGGIVADEDDSTRWRDGRLDNTNDIGDRQAAEKRPHSEILESRRRGRKLVAKCVVLHVNPNQIVQPWSWEAQNARDFLGMEEIGSLVPVNPHAAEVVTQKIVERIPGKERQAVWDPVGLIGVVVVVRLSPLPQIPDRLRPLLVGPRPDAQANSVKRVGRILLKNESVVDAVRLAPASADLNIVGETGLKFVSKECSQAWKEQVIDIPS